MPASPSMGSYNDVRAALDRALESEHGVKVDAKSMGNAIHLRQRMYSFRTLDRKRSTEVYPPGDPRYNTSAYDCLTFTQADTFIYIKKPPPLELIELDG